MLLLELEKLGSRVDDPQERWVGGEWVGAEDPQERCVGARGRAGWRGARAGLLRPAFNSQLPGGGGLQHVNCNFVRVLAAPPCCSRPHPCSLQPPRPLL